MDYKKAYQELCNAITNAIAELFQVKLVTIELDNGIKILKETQCKTEEMYLIVKPL